MSVFNKKASSIKATTFRELLEKKFEEEPSYIAPSVLPHGSTCGIYGDSKVGKSFLCLNMARSLALGENLYDIKEMSVPKECKVLYVEQEVGEPSLQNRVQRIFYKVQNTKLDNLFFVSKVPDLQLDSYDGQQMIKDLISNIRPNVIIFDPIGKLHLYEENSNSQIGELFKTFEEFKKVSPDDKLSIVYSHHVRKPSAWIPGQPIPDPLDPHKASGAGRWFRDPDTIITTHRYDTQKLPWEKWKLKVRVTMRHGSSPDDFVLKVNHDRFEDWNDGDLRVKFYTDLGAYEPLFNKNKKDKKDKKATENKDKSKDQTHLFKL